MTAPRRPLLRYHGGKFRIAKRIIEHFPVHRIYVEPFGGAAGVLLKKERSFAEVYNDLDGDVVNVFRVMRDLQQAQALRRAIELTPWARDEFTASYEPTDDPVERARRTIVRGFMGFGTTSRRAHRTGFRAKAYRQNQTGAMDWRTWPDEIVIFCERLRGVTIENRDAAEIICYQDTHDTLFYVDPPYVQSTRTAARGHDKSGAYAHDLEDADHEELAELLHDVKGMVVLSGYDCPLYSELYADWLQVKFEAMTDGGRKATESLWINPAAQTRGRPLFSVSASMIETFAGDAA